MDESTAEADGGARERKRALRTSLRAGRAGSSHRVADEDALLAGHAADLLALVPGDEAEARRSPLMIAAFHPTATEPDLRLLIRSLHDAGHRVLLPVRSRTHADRVDWALWDPEALLADAPAPGFGAEPRGRREGVEALARADLVLAPALAVDRSGTRLGHGGGYYDRALAHAADAPVVAVVHPWEILAAGALPREEHDRPADAALSTAGLVPLAAS